MSEPHICVPDLPTWRERLLCPGCGALLSEDIGMRPDPTRPEEDERRRIARRRELRGAIIDFTVQHEAFFREQAGEPKE